MSEECDPNVSTAPVQTAPRRSWFGRVGRVAGFTFRAARNLLALAALAEIVMVFTPVPERIYDWLSVDTSTPGKADYIVCLGGGSGREATAAQLWHQKVAPKIVVSNAPGAAEWMRYLVTKSGVPKEAVIVDRSSFTTGEHPAGVAKLSGIDPAKQRFVIVTDHTHTRRARACFVKAGYHNVVMYAGKEKRDSLFLERCKWRIMVLPAIIYESAALAKYWWQGKI